MSNPAPTMQFPNPKLNEEALERVKNTIQGILEDNNGELSPIYELIYMLYDDLTSLRQVVNNCERELKSYTLTMEQTQKNVALANARLSLAFASLFDFTLSKLSPDACNAFLEEQNRKLLNSNDVNSLADMLLRSATDEAISMTRTIQAQGVFT